MQTIRRPIEKLCAKLVIEHATDEEICSLRAYTKSQSDTVDPNMTNNTLFHMHRAEITGNKYLPGVLRDLLHKASRAQRRCFLEILFQVII